MDTGRVSRIVRIGAVFLALLAVMPILYGVTNVVLAGQQVRRNVKYSPPLDLASPLPPPDPNRRNCRAGPDYDDVSAVSRLITDEGVEFVTIFTENGTTLIRVVGETVWVASGLNAQNSSFFLMNFTRAEFREATGMAQGSGAAAKIRDAVVRKFSHHESKMRWSAVVLPEKVRAFMNWNGSCNRD